MPELMINPTPTPPPSGTGNANALSQSDAASRSGESARTDAASGTESPFAAMLKSRMDKKTAAADAANSANPSAAADQTDAEIEAISVDLSALLPLLGANPTGTASVAAVPLAATEQATTAPDEKLLPGLQPATSPPPTQILAAPASAPTAVSDTGPRKQNVEARGETFTSAGPAKPDGTGQASGKIALDAAINADVGRKSGEKNAPDIPANDFHALMERAAAMTPAAASPASGSTSSPTLRIDTPLGQTGWHDEMGQKLTWMVGNNRQQADLVLTPPQLGRVEVSLTMNGDQATAIFTSSNPAVREALESSLHRLREVLADAGVSLGQAQVGSESPNQSSRKNELDFGMKESVRHASTLPLPGVEAVTRTGAGRSMIDVFA
ncbi:MAG: flagellar hook-length control protein FliK [Sulfuritalea sp.]|nr:flagellar hook-length control protein FliK [Sulfuritalea sp.]